MEAERRNRKRRASTSAQVAEPSGTPEWVETVRITVEREAPLVQSLIHRAIRAVLRFAELSKDSIAHASDAPNDLAVLLRALSSGELLEDLRSVEPLAPAFIRGIEAQRRLLEEHGGTLSASQVAQVLGISREAVDKRRQSHSLIALSTGKHGYRYPVWQFTKSGSLPGLKDVIHALEPHDEWMQIAFFVSKNPRLQDETPIEMLKAGELKEVINAASAYGEHGAA